jgi:hypothetical protein
MSGVTILGIAVALTAGATHARHLRQAGRTTEGYVTGLGINTGDGMVSPMYWADVSCDGEEPFSARVYIQADRYEALRKGSLVNVTYLPGRPGSAGVLD